MKIFNQFLLGILLLIILCSTVFGIGISTGSFEKYPFVSNGNLTFSYTLYTDDHYDNDYLLFARGDFAEYVVFDPINLTNIPKKSKIGFSGRIMFPEIPEHYGISTAKICVREECKVAGASCGRAGVCNYLDILALYPGIKPYITFGTKDINRDQPLELKISILNWGQEEIKQCSGTVDIKDINGEIKGIVNLESVSVPSKTSSILEGVFNTEGILPGNFTAFASVDCDGENLDANSTFRIGKLEVKINDYTKTLEAGGIRKFSTFIESAWNDPLEVRGEITLKNNDKSSKARAAEIMLNPWAKEELEAFIDTSSLDIGEYDATIKIFYGMDETVKQGKVTITELLDDSKTDERPIEQQPKASNTLTIALVIIVVMLTLVNIVLAIYRRKKEEK